MGKYNLTSVLSGLALLCSVVHAQPLENKISFEEWSSLVQVTVSRIPELQELWDFSQHQDQRVFLTGGTLRGMLKWLRSELKTKSPNEILSLPPPRLGDLRADPIRTFETDLDLVASDTTLRKLEQLLPKYGMPFADHIELEMHDEFARHGGATFEIIRVNPHEIDDPREGLRHYWQGRLVYAPAKTKISSDGTLEKILRFLRFERTMPELAVSIWSREAMYRAASNVLKEDPRSNRGRLLKCLSRVMDEWQWDPEIFLRLKELGLLEPLSRRGLWFSPPDGFTLSAKHLKGLTSKDRAHLQLMMPNVMRRRSCFSALWR